MKVKVKPLIIVLAASTFLLSACGENKLTDEAKKVKQENKIIKKEANPHKTKSVEKMKEFYKKYEKPIDETVKYAGVDKVEVVQQKEVNQPMDQFKDSVEFAKYAGKVLFEYYTIQISPEQYYQFLNQYGSKSIVKSLPTRDDAIKIFENIQNMFKSKNTEGTDYELTVPILNRLKKEGHFYRKTTTIQGVEYFQTTIVKEDGVWKFVEDGPAPPYDAIK